MKYYCPKCRTTDHWANEVCAKDAATRVGFAGRAEVVPPIPRKDNKPLPEVAAPIKQAQEFIKKLGRPKIYPDRKTQMRELMRRRRAKV